MLNLDVCAKCWKKHSEISLGNIMNGVIKGAMTYKFIWCPTQLRMPDEKQSVNEIPVEKCPYRLEHIISTTGELT